MDELTARVAERLELRGLDGAPSAGLADRVINVMRTRRRRRRRGAVLAAALAVAVVAVPASVLGRGAAPLEPTQTPPVTATGGPPGPPLVAPRAPEALDQVVDRSSALTLPVEFDVDGQLLLFRAEALGAGGIVLGGTGFDADPFRDTDRRIWIGLPATGGRVPLTGPADAWGHAAGGTVLAWLEHRDEQHDYQLMCAQLGSGRPPVQVTRGGVQKYEQPVHTDGDTIAWVDEENAAWVVTGCTGTPRRLPVDGPVVAFAYPEAFVVDLRSGDLRVVDVTTNASAPVAGVPAGIWNGDFTYFAASRELLAWVSNRTLMVLHRRTGRVYRSTSKLPVSNGAAGDRITLTAGDRLVVYTCRPMEGSPETSVAVVYDSATDREVLLASEAYTAGERLLWREGPDYVLATVRP